MSGLRKRALAIAGHRTSVSLEEPFWEALKEIAAAENVALWLIGVDLAGAAERIRPDWMRGFLPG